MQNSYDSKLNNATYDALKAFQLNTINSDTSDIANSKLRDIEASANTFFDSIASNFNMAGYNRDILADYVPALVYTMYDGYYIYSPYTNTLDTTNYNEIPTTGEDGMPVEPITGSDKEVAEALREKSTYHDGEKLSGLKPYIYYSCRYKMGENNFTITYSLDNYITIQGVINGNWVNDSGYLLDNVEVSGNSGVTYRGITIGGNETLKESICDPDNGTIKEYEYIKLNGVKYYHDKQNNKWFSIINGEKLPQEGFDPETTAAIEYYRDAYDFKQKLERVNYMDCNGNQKNDGYGIASELNASHAVDETGNQLKDENDNPKFGDYKIFDFGDTSTVSIEDPDSNFNEQRLAVIRYSIEKNLSIAIANYNNYESETANFMMPKLKEDEWDKIVNNVCIISFLQGLNIGGKIYNGYSIIANNKNQEVVSEDSIYLVTKGENNNCEYHKPTEKDLETKNIIDACFNIDFERKSVTTNNGTKYFYPKRYAGQVPLGSYGSIVTQTEVETPNNMYEDMAKKGGFLAQKYFTALGRERYGMYKTNNDNETLKKKFGIKSETNQ